MERLILDSKLLSGGIENRYLNRFDQTARDQLKSVLEVSGDYTMHELLEIPAEDEQGEAEDERLLSILEPKKNDFVDKLCTLLQYRIERARPMIQYARIGSVDGLRISRAAFSVMIKYNEATNIFDNLVDEVDMIDADLANLKGPEMCAKMQEKIIEAEMENDLKILDNLW